MTAVVMNTLGQEDVVNPRDGIRRVTGEHASISGEKCGMRKVCITAAARMQHGSHCLDPR
eukprot:6261877-Amphidinium_carterae.1